jgi:hypothetical protein
MRRRGEQGRRDGRHGRGVQAPVRRHARELRVGEALRDDDERDAQPGDEVARLDAE